jgi:hypothetical protein
MARAVNRHVQAVGGEEYYGIPFRVNMGGRGYYCTVWEVKSGKDRARCEPRSSTLPIFRYKEI